MKVLNISSARSTVMQSDGTGDMQEVIVLKQGDYILLGARGRSRPPRLIKNGLDIKGPLSFNLFAAAMLRSNGLL